VRLKLGTELPEKLLIVGPNPEQGTGAAVLPTKEISWASWVHPSWEL